MPSDFLLLLPLVGGYLFNHIFFLLRYRAQTLTGHRLVFEAAVSGLLFLLIARGTVYGLTEIGLPSWFLSAWPNVTNRTSFAGTTALAVLAAPPTAALLNLLVGFAKRQLIDRGRFAEKSFLLRWLYVCWYASRSYFHDLAIKTSGNALQKLLHEVAVRGPVDGVTVGLTMSNDKIYAAAVEASPTLSPSDQHVSLLPLMSGHRDTKTREIRYDFAYPLDKYRSLADQSSVVVAVPISEIKSAHMLDSEYYEAELERLRKDTGRPAQAWPLQILKLLRLFLDR